MNSALSFFNRMWLSSVDICWNGSVLSTKKQLVFDIDNGQIISFVLEIKEGSSQGTNAMECVLKKGSADLLIPMLCGESAGFYELDVSFLLIDEHFFPSTSPDVDTAIFIYTGNPGDIKKMPEHNAGDYMVIFLRKKERYDLLRKIQRQKQKALVCL